MQTASDVYLKRRMCSLDTSALDVTDDNRTILTYLLSHLANGSEAAPATTSLPVRPLPVTVCMATLTVGSTSGIGFLY